MVHNVVFCVYAFVFMQARDLLKSILEEDPLKSLIKY